MAATFPGGNNTYIPDHEATNKLRIEYIRDPKRFKLNEYCQMTPVKKMEGRYLKITAEEAARLTSSSGAEFAFPDGNDAPRGTDGTESHEFLGYTCQRFAPTATLGDLAVDQASWDVRAMHARIKAQQAMTLRTQRVVTQLLTTSNYDSSHYSAVASISGNTGNFAASTTARSDIKRSINYAINRIMLDTNASVMMEDLMFVINPNGAAAMSQSQEIVDYLKGTPDSLGVIRGMASGIPKGYINMPDMLYGLPVVVENAVKVTSKKGATRAASFVFSDAYAAVVARPGGIDGVEGAPAFSTCTLFVYSPDDMTVEYRHDIDNRYTAIRVVDSNSPIITAPATGFLFTSAF